MRKRMAAAAAAAAMICLVFASDAVIESARYALSLCAELIVPSLLPFFIASSLLNDLGVPFYIGKLLAPFARRVWGVSGCGASAFAVGVCGGYPLGARYVAELYASDAVGKEEAERLLGFCNNSGPSFIIGAVGVGLFASAKAGLILYATHILSAALTGVILRRGAGAPDSEAPESADKPFAPALVDAVSGALAATLTVCGFVICFCILNGLLDRLGLFDFAASLLPEENAGGRQIVRALICSVTELGGGIGAMRGLEPGCASLAAAAFMVGWGGLSVHFQTMAVLGDSELSCRGFLVGRIVCAALSALIAAAAGALLFS